MKCIFIKSRRIFCMLAVVGLLLFSGCGVLQKDKFSDTEDFTMVPAPTATQVFKEETPSPTPTLNDAALSPAPPPTPTLREETPSPAPVYSPDPALQVSTLDDIQAELYAAIVGLRQPKSMDVSQVNWPDSPEINVKNLYYQIIGQSPELKYAYELSIETDNGTLNCQISYMPYKTGNFPEGTDAVSVSSLQELIAVAQANLGMETVPIRLTDPSFTPDDMSRALQQAGGGYILCALNKDATAITYSSAMGMTMDDCLAQLDEANRLANQVICEVVTDDMTEYQKAEALFSYITEHVKYDQRYYSDRQNMPYDAQTATGALRDHLAICGGYSHAVKLLFEKAGIPCYNVTGTYFGENHMWNVALLDGKWLWCDATADRGNSLEFGLRHFALEELDATQYQWDESLIAPLLEQ